MAQKRTIDIDINTNADEAAKQFETLSTGVKKATDSAENLDAKFEDVFKGVEPLTTRLGEAEDRLYELALAGDTTSKEYQELLTKVGEYRKVQIQTDLAVDQAAQTFSQKLGTALGGATSGFAVVQGTMALVGSESQALEKTLLKVQAALAIQQGVQGVLEYSRSVGLATKATKLWGIMTGTTTGLFKALRVALISTGIGALIVGIGLLISNFDKLIGFFKPVIDGFKAIGDAIGLTDFAAEERFEAEQKRHNQTIANAKEEKQAIDKLVAAEKKRQTTLQSIFDVQIKQAKGNAKEIERIENNKRKAAKDSIDKEERLFLEGQKTRLKQLEAQNKKIQSLLQQANREGVAISQKTLDGAAKGQEAEAKLRQQIIDRNFSALQDFNIRRTNLDIDFQEGVEQRENARTEKFKQHLQDRLNAARKIEDLENELMEDGLEKEIELNRDNFRRQREDLTAQGKQKQEIIDLLNQLELKKEKEIREKFDVFKLESFDGEIAQLELQSVKEIEIKKLTQEEIEKQMAESAARQKAIDDQLAADKRANAIAVADTSLSIAHDSLGAIGELANAFAKDDEKNAKKAFNINKAVGIAQAVVSTAQGIMAQLAVPQDALTGANFVKAGIVAATGAAQIATISKTKFEGGASGETPSLDASSGEAQAPSFNVVGDSGVNQLAQLQQQPVQAFVVSGEVTTSQALDRNRVENATL